MYEVERLEFKLNNKSKSSIAIIKQKWQQKSARTTRSPSRE
jgi:hypothetical protein